MTVVRELIAVLGFEVDEAGAKKAEAALSTLHNGALALVGAFTAAAVGLGLMVKKTADAGEAANKMGQRLGITAVEFQELSFVMERAGLEGDNLNEVFKGMQVRAQDAAEGGKESSAAFRRLGVSVKDSSGKVKTGVPFFKELADGFAKIEDPALRSTIAVGIFGRAGIKLAPAFADGSAGIEELIERARDLGHIIGNEDAQALDDFGDGLEDIGSRVTGLTRRLSIALLPTLQKLVTRLDNWLSANRRLIDEGIGKLAKGIETVISGLSTLAGWIVRHQGLTLAFIALALVPMGLALNALSASILGVIGLSLLAAGPWLLAGAVIALVVEDIYKFLNGGKSLLGVFFDRFVTGAKPSDHWMVFTMTLIVDGIVNAIRYWQEFVNEVVRTDLGSVLQKKWGWNPMTAFGEFAADVTDAVSPSRMASDIFGATPETSLSPVDRTKLQLERLDRMNTLAADRSIGAPSNMSQSPGVSVSSGDINISVQTSSSNPSVIAQDVSKAVGEEMSNRLREAERQLGSRRVR